MTKHLISFIFSFPDLRHSSGVANTLHSYRVAFGDGLRPVRESSILIRMAVDLGVGEELAKLKDHIAFASSSIPSFLFMYLDADTTRIHHIVPDLDRRMMISGSRADLLFCTVARNQGRWEFVDYASPPEFIAALVACATAYAVPTSDFIIERIGHCTPAGNQFIAGHCRQQWHEPLPRFVVVQANGSVKASVSDIQDKVATYLQRNTAESLTKALRVLGNSAMACEGHEPPETLSKLAEMTEPVFQMLAATGPSSRVLYDALFQEASRVLERSFQARETRGALAAYYYYKAGYHWELKEYERSVNLFSDAAEIMQRAGRKDLQVLALYRQVLCLVMLCRLKSAAETAREAWDIAVEMNDRRMQANLDDIFSRLNESGISKPESQRQVSFAVRIHERFLADTAYPYTIIDSEGLSSVSCARIVKLLNEMQGDVQLEKEGQSVNAKSIMALLMLAVTRGSNIRLTFSEPQDGRALDPVIAEGILVPEGTDARYVCYKCGKENYIRAEKIGGEQVCVGCGNRNLLRLRKYDIVFEGR